MGYLINAWNETQKKFTMTLKQIVNIAGDETLESEETVKEMREFFTLIDSQTMERLLKECYSKEKKHKFEARGFAFQDLINEMGRRLGYEVENGLYRGKKNEVGFDGLWKAKDGSYIIMESKVSGDYAFIPETVIGYRDKLIAERAIPRKKISVLVVYGRDEKNALRSAIKGSDESPNMRLISANALFQLVRILIYSKSLVSANQIYTILRPRDYFVLDNLVELVFPETDPEIEEIEDDDIDQETVINESEGNDGDLVPSEDHTQKVPVPALPDDTLKVGAYVRTAMENLASSGYEFSDSKMEELLGSTSLHDVVGLSRKLPFFKLYEPDNPKGHYIEGRIRFYSKPLMFGKYTVYLTKELFENDKKSFKEWYGTLK